MLAYLGKVAIVDKYVAIHAESEVHVYKNGGDFSKVIQFELKSCISESLTFASPDCLMATTPEGVFFASLPSEEITGPYGFESSRKPDLWGVSCSVLHDGRICFGASGGSGAIFEPPESLREGIRSFGAKMYEHSLPESSSSEGDYTADTNPEIVTLKNKLSKEQETKEVALTKVKESLKEIDSRLELKPPGQEKLMEELRKQKELMKGIIELLDKENDLQQPEENEMKAK